MYPYTRFELVAFGVFLLALGIRLIARPLAARPDDDSPGARLVGGFVVIALGLVLGAVGLDLMSTGR